MSAHVDPPGYLAWIENGHEYVRPACGANYALLKTKSVVQFAEKAALGLVVKKRSKSADGWTDDWYYEATLLWAQEKLTSIVTTEGTEEFKIICQPDYDNPTPTAAIKPDHKAYDLLPVPCRKRGMLQFELDLDTETDTLSLIVNHRPLSESEKTQRSTEDMQ